MPFQRGKPQNNRKKLFFPWETAFFPLASAVLYLSTTDAVFHLI